MLNNFIILVISIGVALQIWGWVFFLFGRVKDREKGNNLATTGTLIVVIGGIIKWLSM